MRLLAGLSVVAVLSTMLLVNIAPAQEDKNGNNEPKAKQVRRLPAGYGNLGLSNEQREKIYTIRGQYQAKVQALEAQIQKVKVEELETINKVLTPAQQARIKEIAAEKAKDKK